MTCRQHLIPQPLLAPHRHSLTPQRSSAAQPTSLATKFNSAARAPRPGRSITPLRRDTAHRSPHPNLIFKSTDGLRIFHCRQGGRGCPSQGRRRRTRRRGRQERAHDERRDREPHRVQRGLPDRHIRWGQGPLCLPLPERLLSGR